MTVYDWFVIAAVMLTWPLILIVGVVCWLLVVRLIIDFIKYGW